MRPMFGDYGGAIAATSVSFVSQAAVGEGVTEQIGLVKLVVAVSGTR